MSDSVLIIGGGMGGLFTGAFLAKEGRRVTVLEKNAAAGGGLQTFTRKGVTFDTGLHVVGGFGHNGNLRKICAYLGIADRLSLRPAEADCADTLTYLASGKTYRIGNGRQRFTESLLREFPEESEGIKAYMDTLYRITEAFDLYKLRRSESRMPAIPEEGMTAADELIARHTGNPRLREVLAYMNPMYAGEKGHTPAYVHALLNVLLIEERSRFVGDSGQLADALRAVIEGGGGKIVCGAEATRIQVADRRVGSVETADGRQWTADHYVCAVHPREMLGMTDKGAFTKAYRNRLESIPDSYSAFMVFIEFKDKSFPYIDHTCYCQDDFGMVWSHARSDGGDWPRGFMYMTPPEPGQGQWARRMNINCVMDFDSAARWEDTLTGRRGPDYEAWKQAHTERTLDKMERLHPGFRNTIKNLYAASPLTIRDYYHTHRGAIYGYRKDCRFPELSQLPVYTKISNLYLTGQNVNLHGICGVPLTAISTAEAIVGRNTIIDKINNKYAQDHGND